MTAEKRLKIKQEISNEFHENAYMNEHDELNVNGGDNLVAKGHSGI